jgi:hypothetical protein
MTAIWPTELPAPLIRGFGKDMVDTRQEKRTDTGPAGFRSRFSGTYDTLKVIISVSLDQLCLFENFTHDTLKNRSLPFWMADPQKDGAEIWVDTNQPLLDENGNVVLVQSYELYLFGKALPQQSFDGVAYDVAFELRRMP